MRNRLVGIVLAVAILALLVAFVVWHDSIKFLAPWGPWLGALATFLAALIALRLHTRFFPPKLELALLSEDGEATDVTIATRDEQGVVTSYRPERARYYHVRLTNMRPWFVATETSVVLLSVDTPDASGTFTQAWAGALPVVAKYYHVHPTRTLGAAPQDFDLCSVVRNKWVELHVTIVTNNFPQRHRQGEHVKLRLTLQARSMEALSPPFVFDVAWDGKWEEDTVKMRKHMVVRQVN